MTAPSTILLEQIEENRRLRGLLVAARDALYPAITMLDALKRQGLGSKAHAHAMKTYEAIVNEVGKI